MNRAMNLEPIANQALGALVRHLTISLWHRGTGT